MAYKYPYAYEEEEYQEPELQTDRSMWKFMLLNLLTLGIYSIIFFTPFSYDIDKVAPKRDRSKTMNYLFVYILAIFTFSIVIYIWHYQIAQRVEEALSQRKINYEFETGTFWTYLFFGSFILIGPFVYYHKLCRAMNLLCEDYNKSLTVK